jgi:ribosomal protein S18 acetylase RimI-like enzyme
VIIRPIHPDDLDAFRAMRIEGVRDCPLGFTADLGETQGRPIEWWRDLITRNSGNQSSVILVADECDGKLAGMIGCHAPTAPKLAHVATIWGVYVRPLFRGQRLADQLLRACLDWARTKPFVSVKLSVVASNDVAKRCYERCGFTTYGVETVAVQWDGALYDELLMSIRLK